MKKASPWRGEGRTKRTESITPGTTSPDLIANLRLAARDPAAAKLMSAALKRAAIYDDEPRDSLREYVAARQSDRRFMGTL